MTKRYFIGHRATSAAVSKAMKRLYIPSGVTKTTTVSSKTAHSIKTTSINGVRERKKSAA
ncbi:MAG TPA: hypothetical protein VNN20_10250 [Thermodesulfobacteriota bacterium]|nr:hypothetical protein [Thermodesulfobacteriota bacterium]